MAPRPKVIAVEFVPSEIFRDDAAVASLFAHAVYRAQLQDDLDKIGADQDVESQRVPRSPR
jgi:hypothetical protein